MQKRVSKIQIFCPESSIFPRLFLGEGREYKLGNWKTRVEAHFHPWQSPVDRSPNLCRPPFPQPQGHMNPRPALCCRVFCQWKPSTTALSPSLGLLPWPAAPGLSSLAVCTCRVLPLIALLAFPLYLILLRSGQEQEGSCKDGSPETRPWTEDSEIGQSTWTAVNSSDLSPHCLKHLLREGAWL